MADFTYLDLAGFRDATTMPSGEVDRLEARSAGWIQKRCAWWSSYVNDQLKKRYAVPFDTSSPPATVLRWLVDLVTFDAYRKLGFSPTSAQDVAAIVDPMTRALEQLKEAADSKDGLFELPLRNDAQDVSGVARGGPLGYSEASPYTWTDLQADAAAAEEDT